MTKVLLGFMGAGKTTIASLLNQHYIDMDHVIEEKIGMPIVDFFARKGEAAFRQIETQVLEDLLGQDGDMVIATGGGVILSAYNRELLRKNRRNNVLLAADFEVLYQRIAADRIYQRPLFLNNSKEDFRGIFEHRMHLYEGLADLVITVDNRTPEEVARLVDAM